MYCKVCGNFLSETDKVCEVCGNDVEQQRRQELAATEAAKTVGYAQREEKSEIDREKDEAINRIFYEGDGASAHSRLEERRRKRAQEKNPGLGGFFAGRSSQESIQKTEKIPAEEAPSFTLPVKEAPPVVFEVPAFEAPVFETPVIKQPEPKAAAPVVPEPKAPAAAVHEEKPTPRTEGFSLGRIESVHAAEPVQTQSGPSQEDDRPRRNFRSEFVFGDRPKPAPAPTHLADSEPSFSSAVQPSETFTPEPIPFVPELPQTPVPVSFAPEPAPAPIPEPAPAPVSVPDDFFALKVDEAEQALFDINKKNEEFQELLDEEFERLRHGGIVASEANSLVNEEVLAQVEPTPEILVTSDNARELVEDRIDDYLKRADLDMLKEIQARLEKELSEKAAPEPKPIPASVDPWVQAKREPEPVPGFAFDGKDFGHALAHGAAPVSDIKTTADAYIAQTEETTPEGEIILSQETLLEIPEKEEPQGISYSVLDEMFGNIPDTGESGDAPVPDVTLAIPAAPARDPGVKAVREPAPVPGFAFDGTDYGHALSHGGAPVSDIKTVADAYISQAEEGLSEDEAVLAHETDLEFKAPSAKEDASAPISYADFEIFDFSKEEPPAPIPEPLAAPAPIPEPVAAPAPTPVAEPSVLPAGWGRGAPTREQAEAFLNRDVTFPFDDPVAKPPVAPRPVAEPEPVAVVVAPEPIAEPAPAPIPHPQTGSEILSSRPQWRPEISFIDLLAPTALITEVPLAETPLAETPAAVVEAPTIETPVFAPLTPIAPSFETPAPEAPALEPPIPEAVAEADPLPTTPTAISYDDALAAPTVTGTPMAPATPRTAERVSDLRDKPKKPVSTEPSKLQRNVISVIITVLIIILVLVIACIATLKFMPDSVGAYYILDFIETIQAKLSGG